MIITAKLKSNFYLTSLTEILTLTFASKTFWQTVLVHFPTIFNSVTGAYCFFLWPFDTTVFCRLPGKICTLLFPLHDRESKPIPAFF